MMTNTTRPGRSGGNDADQRVTRAREYLAGARRRKVDQLPPSVMMLGQVLAVIEGQAAALTPAQLASVLKALGDAITARNERAHRVCTDCEEHPAGLCDETATDLDALEEYRQLERDLIDQAGAQ